MQNLFISPSAVKSAPESPGVYLLIDGAGSFIYIGKANNLKKRLQSHFSPTDDSIKENTLRQKTQKIEIIPLPSQLEALLLESELIRRYQPKYNVIAKDDKHYIYLLITKEEYPKILFARKIDQGKGYFYGPFPSSRVVRDLILFSRNIIPFCTEKNIGRKPCFYTHIGLCDPCPSSIATLAPDKRQIQKKIYKNNITLVRYIFEGKIKKLQKYIEGQMSFYAKAGQYEKAAYYRDRLFAFNEMLNYFTSQSKKPDLHQNISNRFQTEEQNLLASIKIYYPNLSGLRKIECYDISNIQGKFATGSMVAFIDGNPDKSFYRRFRIRLHTSSGGPDDYKMIHEVLSRRLDHPEWKFPDLLVIDGGRGQVSTAMKTIKSKNLNIPVIGLAKRYEEIVIAKDNTFLSIRLDRDNMGLHLLQRLRDEAHRFARIYHHLLSLKYLIPKK